MPAAVFYVLHTFSDAHSEWLPLLDVRREDWERLARAFTYPRKLLLYVIGCFIGCEGAFKHAPDSAAPVDLQAQGVGDFYFFPNVGMNQRLLPLTTWNIRPKRSSASSSSTRSSSTTHDAKARDLHCCVVSGANTSLRGSHLLPKAMKPDDIEEICDIRAPPSDRLSSGEDSRNKLTLYSPLHDKYDRGEICFLPVPNWILTLQEVQSTPARPATTGASMSTAPRGSFTVIYVNATCEDWSQPAVYRTGQVCRLYKSGLHPPSWLLEIGVARAFVISFGVKATVDSMLQDADNDEDGNHQHNTPELHQSHTSHPSPATPKSPTSDRMRTRSQGRSVSNTRVQELDQLFWGCILRQPRRVGPDMDLEDERDEASHTEKVAAWLTTLPAREEAGSTYVPDQ